MKTRKRGGRLEVINGAWGFPESTKWGDETTDKYRGLELKTFTDLGVPITQPNSTEVLRDKVLVQRYHALCEACKTDECYDNLNEIKKNIRKIIKLRTLGATDHFKENETEQEERDRVGHEGRLELWRSNYSAVNDLFQTLRKELKKPFEVDTDILTNDKLTISKKKGLVTSSLQLAVKDIGSIDKDFSIKPFVELQVDVNEIIKTTTALQTYVAGMPEGLLHGLTEIIKRTGEIQTAVVEGDRKSSEMQVKLKDLVFMFETRLPRVLEITTVFNEAVTAFSFSMPLPEINRFSESLEQFIREIEEEMRISRDMLETRRIKLDGILRQINKEEDELLEEEKKETQLEEEEKERVRQEVKDARLIAKQTKKQPERVVTESQDDIIEKEYQLALERRAAEKVNPERGEPAEEPERSKGQIYKKKQEEYEKVMESIQKGYLDQGALTKDATDIEDLLNFREEIIRVLETTELSKPERQKKEKELATNLSKILRVNPTYAELVKESDGKLKEIFKLGMILSELEQYMTDHYADIAPPPEPTEEERLAQFEEDIRRLPRRDFLTRLVDKQKLYNNVTERIEKIKESHANKQARLDKTMLELNGLTASLPEETKRDIENWAEVFKLYAQLPEEERLGETSMDVISKLMRSKEKFSEEPHPLAPVVVNTIERYIIQKHTQMTEIAEIKILLDALSREQARLSRELEILKKKGGTRRKNKKRYSIKMRG